MSIIHFTWFDYVVVALMVFSCVFAFCRGLVREILSLAAWLGAGVVTIYYFQAAAIKLQAQFKNPLVADVIAAVGVYMIALICFTIINIILLRSFKSSKETGMLDNMLGLLFGAARGALIISLGFFLLTVAMPEQRDYPAWLKEAVTRPYVEKGAALLAKVAPEYMLEISSVERRAQGKPPVETTAPAVDDTNTSKTTPNDTGYDRTTTKQLDRLIEGTGGK